MYDVNVASPYGPQIVRIGLPPASLLKFPPGELPATIPAAQISEPTWKQPFNIPPTLYNQVLDARVPVTIAGVYAVTVVVLNRVNKSRGFKPYAFSQTSLFKLLVVLHNVFLAVYSAWTFAGMFLAMRNSTPDADDPHGLAGVADAMCKINGPRGYGNAATYNTTTDQWTIRNPEFKLRDGIPDPADAGRLWNNGLAYFGWIFYLSKFYEVLDTAIILAKGKRSSTLQTYHHAGAMMCMWAGIRYMAAPIWIFPLVNSGIHFLMYTYYTLTSLHVCVPTAIKRSLTTMQIMQFVFGSTMAASYLFVLYTVPGNAQLSTRPVTEGLVPWLKQLSGTGAEASQLGASNQMVTCMDTSGQGFAIWLNVLYLLPLTYLFARFFVRSYLYRKPGAQRQTHIHAAEKAGLDALRGVSREIQKSVELNAEGSETTEDEASKVTGKKAQANGSANGAANGGAKTRSAAANKKKEAAEGEAEEFAPVAAKRGSKRGGKAKETVPSVPAAKGQNPFEVLNGKP